MFFVSLSPAIVSFLFILWVFGKFLKIGIKIQIIATIVILFWNIVTYNIFTILLSIGLFYFVTRTKLLQGTTKQDREQANKIQYKPFHHI